MKSAHSADGKPSLGMCLGGDAAKSTGRDNAAGAVHVQGAPGEIGALSPPACFLTASLTRDRRSLHAGPTIALHASISRNHRPGPRVSLPTCRPHSETSHRLLEFAKPVSGFVAAAEKRPARPGLEQPGHLVPPHAWHRYLLTTRYVASGRLSHVPKHVPPSGRPYGTPTIRARGAEGEGEPFTSPPELDSRPASGIRQRTLPTCFDLIPTSPTR
jgi:hypothetical protein